MQIALPSRAIGIGAFAVTGVIVLLATLAVFAGSLPELPFAAAIQGMQRLVHEDLIDAVDRAATPGLSTLVGLAAVSYAYGILHAAGPGHGKAVLTTYLLTHGAAVRRGLMLSIASALCQGLCAIVLVALVTQLLDWSAGRAQAAATFMEAASFALVALLGLFLMWRGARLLFRRRGMTLPPRVATTEMCACGHAHAPDHHAIADARSWRESLAVILAIGARPCTGAILVLLATQAIGSPSLGILSVLAMSLGTASAVGLLALFAVKARQAAMHLTSAVPSIWFARLSAGLTLVGGSVIFALGMILAEGAMRMPQHPLL